LFCQLDELKQSQQKLLRDIEQERATCMSKSVKLIYHQWQFLFSDLVTVVSLCVILLPALWLLLLFYCCRDSLECGCTKIKLLH